MRAALSAVLPLTFAMGASAHRLDDYLQATLITLERDRVVAQIRLTPGVAVFPGVMSTVDTNGDGMISAAEKEAYADRVLGDVSLTLNGRPLKPRLLSISFPETGTMKEGLGEIQLTLSADLLDGVAERKLVFENHHQKAIAAYLVNCLQPQDPNIRVIAQNRDYEQSRYELTYVQSSASPHAAWLALVPLFLLGRAAMLWRTRSA